MPDRRPNPAIEVFGLDEDVWTGPHQIGQQQPGQHRREPGPTGPADTSARPTPVRPDSSGRQQLVAPEPRADRRVGLRRRDARGVVRGSPVRGGFQPGRDIGGHRAVLSAVGGGLATLAWEPKPGTIVFIGYSGGLNAHASGPTLVDLARGGRLLNHAQWTATHPSEVNSSNAYF